jgi:FtsZ-binding cell division protein ZapB
MGRNQYKNLEETPHIAELDKDNKFYEWNLSNNKWVKGDEIKDYKIHYNYHAHIVMLNYDFTKHRTIRNNLKDLSKMQTLVARDLGMERGKCSSYVEAQRIGVEVQESRKRLNIKEYKVQKRKENELKKEVQELKQELYNFKEMQKSITSMELTSYEKKELHRLNSKVKNKTATIEELNKKIEELKKLTHYKEDTFKDIASALRERYNKLQNEVNELKEKKPTNENDVNENKKALEDIKKKNEELRNENSQLKLMILKLQKSLIIDFEDFEINEDKNRNGTKVNDLTFDEMKGILSNLKNEADLKETQDNLKEIIENEEKKETTVVNNIRKIF